MWNRRWHFLVWFLQAIQAELAGSQTSCLSQERTVEWEEAYSVLSTSLQRETLLRQLETNQLDIDATLEELSVQQETEDQNYSMYVSQHLQLCWPSLPWPGGWLLHPIASRP